ncbi:MAG: ABC transporter ATP-binding protein [Planctomycetota bacterium]|jgi:ABC-2 type transport system ATP-binding protein
MVNAPDPRDTIVEASGLVKVFSDFWMRAKARAVDGIDFSIRRDEIFGLLGPNGSGKSTTIKMILGLLRKTRGRLTVFGKDPSDVSIKKRIGYLPEESYMYRFLNARETLEYYGRIFGLRGAVRRRRAEELLEMVGLGTAGLRPVGEYSKGMTRRLGIAQALINDPEFLILDEPTSGLDPIGTRQVKDLLLDLKRRGKTILLSSHLLADVEDVCDRMTILYGGKVRATGTGEELLRDTEHTLIRTSRLDDATIAEVERVLSSRQGVGVEGVEHPRQRLEELFLQIVERARAEQATTSGAAAGGTTAKFLLGEAEAESGSELIDGLVSGREDAPAVPAPGAASAGDDSDRQESDRRKAVDAAVLDELVEGEPDAPTTTRISPPEPPKGVDDAVIEGLLGGDGTGDGDAADGKGGSR